MAEHTTVEAEKPEPKAAIEDAEIHGAARILRRNPNAKSWIIGFAAVLVLVSGWFLWNSFAYESTDDAQIDAHIHAISARISGHIAKVNVDDNQYVQAGAVLAEIDPADYQVALQRAQGDLADAEGQSAAARTGVPLTTVTTGAQLTSAEAELENARAGLDAAQQQYDATVARLREAEANNVKAQADLQRFSQLVGKDEVSRQEYDQAVAAAASTAATFDAARANVATAKQQIVQAQSRIRQAQSGVASAKTAPEQVSVTRSRAIAAAGVAQKLQAAVDQAKLNLQYTKIIAPVSGIVGSKSVETGQNVQPGQQLMVVVPLEEVYVTANFKETQLKHMKPGQEVEVSVDAYGRTYKGKVESIAAASGSRLSLLPPENATGNYVKVVQRVPVKIVLDPGSNADHRLRPGMSVDPKVRVR